MEIRPHSSADDIPLPTRQTTHCTPLPGCLSSEAPTLADASPTLIDRCHGCVVRSNNLGVWCCGGDLCVRARYPGQASRVQPRRPPSQQQQDTSTHNTPRPTNSGIQPLDAEVASRVASWAREKRRGVEKRRNQMEGTASGRRVGRIHAVVKQALILDTTTEFHKRLFAPNTILVSTPFLSLCTSPVEEHQLNRSCADLKASLLIQHLVIQRAGRLR